MYRLLALCLALLVSACSATGPKYTEMAASTPAVAPDKSRIYFYRNDAFAAGGRSAPITINGVLAGECANAGFIYTDLKPGNHVITTELWDAPGKYTIYYNAEAGKTHYIRIAPREDALTAGVLFGVIGMAIESGNSDKGGVFALLPTPPQQATADLARLAYSGTAEATSVQRDFGTASISQPASAGNPASAAPAAPAPANAAGATASPAGPGKAPATTTQRKIAAGSWGFLSGHNDRLPQEVYSRMITRLMHDNLRDTGHTEVKPIAWAEARAIEYESNDYPHSKAICASTGADLLYVNVLENTVGGGNAVWFPESTYYLFDCARGEKQYKTYTLDLHIEDGADFKYEYTLNKTFRDFIARHSGPKSVASSRQP